MNFLILHIHLEYVRSSQSLHDVVSIIYNGARGIRLVNKSVDVDQTGCTVFGMAENTMQNRWRISISLPQDGPISR